MTHTADVIIRTKLSEYLSIQQVEDVMRTVDQALEDIRTEVTSVQLELREIQLEQQVTKNDLQSVQLKLRGYDALMTIPYTLNISNELCKFIAIAKCQEYDQSQPYETYLATANRLIDFVSEFTSFPKEAAPGLRSIRDELASLKVQRNIMIHKLLQLIKQLSTLDENVLNDLVSTLSNGHRFAADIMTNLSPIVFFLITSEAIQRCKYDLLQKIEGVSAHRIPSLRWLNPQPQRGLSHLERSAVHNHISLGLTTADLLRLFSTFETREHVTVLGGYRTSKPMSRQDIIDAYETWALNDISRTQPMDSNIEALWPLLPDLMSIAEQCEYVQIQRRFFIRLSRYTANAKAAAGRMFQSRRRRRV